MAKTKRRWKRKLRKWRSPEWWDIVKNANDGSYERGKEAGFMSVYQRILNGIDPERVLDDWGHLGRQAAVDRLVRETNG